MYSFNIISLALIIVAVASNAQFDELPSIENSSELDTRIVGGKSAIIGQFPHQVSLRSSYTKKHFCGGSIITPRFILTAAHCSQGGFASPSNVYAVVGALTRLVGGTVVHLEKITPHQKFNKTILKHDISLIRTATEIIFSRLVRPIALPTKSLPETGDVPVTISGWGLTGSGNSRLPIFLKFGNTDTLNLSECRHQFKEIKLNDNVHDTNVCTKNPVNRGACMGDSGGPLITKDKILVGIVSWGIACARGFPDVYTGVYQHIDWIGNEMEKQSAGANQ